MTSKLSNNYLASKKPWSKTRILVFGTFDGVHKGHLNFFKQARALAKHPFLIVSVAKDVNVKKIKGRKPLLSEKLRLVSVKKNKLVDSAVLGAAKDYIKHIVSVNPNIIALGYDQTAYTKDLQKKLLKLGLKVKIKRLKSYFPKLYKSSLIHD